MYGAVTSRQPAFVKSFAAATQHTLPSLEAGALGDDCTGRARGRDQAAGQLWVTVPAGPRRECRPHLFP